jgi:hypothetical protein
LITQKLHFILPLLAVVIAAVLAAAATIRSRYDRRPGVLLDLIPPEGSASDLRAWVLFFGSLYAIAHPRWKRWLLGQPWVVFELWSEDGNLGARCWAPARLERLVTVLVRSALPGIEVRPAVEDPGLRFPATRTRLRLDRDPLYVLADPKPDELRSVMLALAAAPSGVIQLALSPDVGWQTRALRQLDQAAGLPPEHGFVMSVVGWIVDGLFHLVLHDPGEVKATPKRPSRPAPPGDKAMRPGYRAEIRLRVAAPTDGEANAQMHALVAACRSFDGANGLRPAHVWFGKLFDKAVTSRRAPGGAGILTAEELAGVFHLPADVAGFESAPVRLGLGRRPQSSGKVICLTEDGSGTPVAISPADSRQHIHVLGPTGAGKTTLLLNLALDDIRAGRGVAVIDPKGDLVRDLLERIPAEAADRLVLLDPSARERPVGLNVLECPDPDLHEVVCDQVVAIFKKTYDRYWGPRTDDVLRGALLTLLRHPGSTLCEVPLLLLQPAARAKYVQGIVDPVGLEPFWDEYEQLPNGQRLQMVGPLLNKLRSFLLRRTVRNVLGQSQSTLDLPRILDGGGVLLVSLAKGLLGEETSRLMGSFLVARIWQAAMARADRPESERPDFSLYLDEFQNYLHLPQNLDDVLVEARGYHLGLVLANQHLGQLATTTREALAANARTRVAFQSGQDDARYLAREFAPWLEEHHLRNLQRFQVAVRMCRDGRTDRPFTGVTRPMPPSLGELHSAELRDAALARFGRPRDQVEGEIVQRLRDRGLLGEEEALTP